MGKIKKAEEKNGDGGVTVVVLNMKLHCEGCAEKVKKTLKHFNGVDSVKADHKTNKLIVVGKVEPIAIKKRVEEKTKKKVDLVSPKPAKKEQDGGKISQEKSEKKPDDEPKKGEEKKPKEMKPLVTTVVLKTRVHCDDCAHKMKKILHKYEGVQEVSVDQAKDQITIKGTMDLKEMLPYLNVKLKRVVEVAPPPPPPKKGSGGEKMPKDSDGVVAVGDKKGKEDAKPTGGGGDGGEKKGKEDAKTKKGKEDAKTTTTGGEKKVDNKSVSGGGGGAEGGGGKLVEEINVSKIVEVVNKMEHNGYPYGYGAYTYSYNPQQTQAVGNGFVSEYWHAPPNYIHAPGIFSDENPNACSIM